MRLLIRLRALADATYDTSYHHKLRGRLWRALEDSNFDNIHDTGDPPGFAFSNIFPWGEIAEGDERTVIVASPKEGVLATIAESLRENPEFNVGEMPFQVTDMSALDVDVGEPGSTGTIQTATGVVVRLYEDHREEYGIVDEDAGGEPTYWLPEHTVEPFQDAILDNLQRKHDQFSPDYTTGPMEMEGQLFEAYELIKTYALPVTVTTDQEIDIVLSKWRLDYRVRDDTHRRNLNLALNTGIGGRNALGFGFLNITEKRGPDGTILEATDAVA